MGSYGDYEIPQQERPEDSGFKDFLRNEWIRREKSRRIAAGVGLVIAAAGLTSILVGDIHPFILTNITGLAIGGAATIISGVAGL